MQFKPWYVLYEENKDKIEDINAFYKEWNEKHNAFLNKVNPLTNKSYVPDLQFNLVSQSRED